ncbi:unnamed protein product [Arctogadus glacialis]
MGANEEKGGTCGTIFLKYLLFTFNFLFWLAGGVVMGVGVWTLVEKSEYISLLPSKTYAASAYILVLAGAIVMVTGVLGCCATFKEQRRLLRVPCERDVSPYIHNHSPPCERDPCEWDVNPYIHSPPCEWDVSPYIHSPPCEWDVNPYIHNHSPPCEWDVNPYIHSPPCGWDVSPYIHSPPCGWDVSRYIHSPQNHRRTTAEPQENYRRTTAEPQENHSRTTGEPQQNHRRTTGELQQNHRRTTGELQENYSRTTGEPQENHRRTTAEPQQNHNLNVELKHSLRETMVKKYEQAEQDHVTRAVDKLQQEFKCCGSNRSGDWADSVWVRSARAEGRAVPDSCCKSPTAGCGARDHPSNIYRVEGGCVSKLENLILDHLKIIGMVGVAIASVQVTGMVFTCCLYRSLNADTL